MGEAKRKQEAMRQMLLREAEEWLSPATEEEAALVAELATRTPIAVRRESAAQLAWTRMQPRECHANVGWYVANDPTGSSRQVSGWWPQGDIYVLHSVVGSDKGMSCITPQLIDVPQIFPFIPDGEIEWVEDGERRHPYRRGWRLPRASVRANPNAQIETTLRIKERLLSGMSPWQAMQLADAEACERLGISR